MKYLLKIVLILINVTENVRCSTTISCTKEKRLRPKDQVNCNEISSELGHKIGKKNVTCETLCICGFGHVLIIESLPSTFPGFTYGCVKDTKMNCCVRKLRVDVIECHRKHSLNYRYELSNYTAEPESRICGMTGRCNTFYYRDGNKECELKKQKDGSYFSSCQNTTLTSSVSNNSIATSTTNNYPNNTMENATTFSLTSTVAALHTSSIPYSTPVIAATSHLVSHLNGTPTETLTGKAFTPMSTGETPSVSSSGYIFNGGTPTASSFNTIIKTASTSNAAILSIIPSVAATSSPRTVTPLPPTRATFFGVTFIVAFNDIQWHDQYTNRKSSLTLTLIDNLTENVKKFYAGDKYFYSVSFAGFRKGSTIAEFTITYASSSSMPILKLQEDNAITGNLFGLRAKFLNISSNKVPPVAPVAQSLSTRNSSSIRISWSFISYPELLGYKVYYKATGKRFEHDIYKSVGPSTTQTDVTGLQPITKYVFRVLGFSKHGEGIGSEPITESTDEGVPSSAPSSLELTVYSSTRIGFVWSSIPNHQRNGVLLGYNISFTWYNEAINQTRCNHTIVSPFAYSIILQDLEKYTTYTVHVCGFTSKGCGPWSNSMNGKTHSNVPDRPPSNVTAYNFTSPSSTIIKWGPIQRGHENGRLRQYRLTFKLLETAETEVSEATQRSLTVGIDTYSIKLENLTANSIYRVEIAGENDAGIGKAEIIYVETCRCPKILYTNYWANPPYLRINSTTGDVSGIFPDLVKRMLTWACGICTNGHNETVIEMTSNGKGMTSQKGSIVEVMDDIDDVTQVSFPLYGNKDFIVYKGMHRYVHLVDSPGIAFVTASQKTEPVTTAAVIRCFPFIGFALCLGFISGVVLWLLESQQANSQFSSQFTRGVKEGFWFSFITMTTVGYGDFKPFSVLGRIFSIIWTLIGLIMISIMLSVMANFLTTDVMESDVIVYGTKIAALENSTEYRVGVLKNALFDKDEQYLSIDNIQTALKNGDVKGALIDTYVAADQEERLFDQYIKVQKILDRTIGYGVVLSGDAKVLHKRCKDFVKKNLEEITSIIRVNTKTLKPSIKSEAVEKSQSLFDPDSYAFKRALMGSAITLLLAVLVGLVWHFVFSSKRSKVSSTNKHKQVKDELKILMLKWFQHFRLTMSTLRKKHKNQIKQLIRCKRKDSKSEYRDKIERIPMQAFQWIDRNESIRRWKQKDEYTIN